MRRQAIVLATALALVPLGARAADLVVWWEKGFYAQEDEAVAEIIAAFEQGTGKQVELVQPAQDEVSVRRYVCIAAEARARREVMRSDRRLGFASSTR